MVTAAAALIAGSFSSSAEFIASSNGNITSLLSRLASGGALDPTQKLGGSSGSGTVTTFNLTTGVDNITGTSGTDTFTALLGPGATLNAFDSVNGGEGTDTLNISANAATNFTLPPSGTLSGMEIVNVTQLANGGAGTGVLTVTNTSFGTGVQKFTYTDASAATDMTAAAVNITLNSATHVSASATGAGTFTTVAVTDTSTTAASTGSTLTTVSVQKASGAVTLTGNGIVDVSLNAVAGLTTITAAAATRALLVKASGTVTQGGLTDAQATSATLTVSGAQTFGTLTVAKATSVTVNANAAVTETIAAATATSLTLNGTALNTLTVTGTNPIATITVTGSGGVTANVAGLTALTTLDTSASTAAAPASGVATGANTFTIGTGVTVTGGAGQEVITVGATTKSISLGAGNDTANVSVTALGTGGSISGGDGTDTLKLSNANAVTLSTAGATQTAFKAAVTGFEILDITDLAASTIAVGGAGTFTTVKYNSTASAVAQVLSGITSGYTIDATFVGAFTGSVTTNALTASADTINYIMRGDLTGGTRAFGTLATPGAETVNISTVDTNATPTATQATMTLTNANANTINISGNNGVNLTHTGTALFSFNASGVTRGGVTLTSGALSTDAIVVGSTSGGDTLNFAAAVAKTTMTATAGTNALTGSSTFANTITGGSGVDTIVGGSAADTINGGAGADTITGGLGADTMTGGAGADIFAFATNGSVAGTSMDVITDFNTGGSDVLQFGAAGVLQPSDATAAVAGTNVQQSAGGLLTFATADNTLALKIAAIQADHQLDAINSVAFFVDSGNTYFYYAGATVGNADDQVVQLTGVTSLATITAGASNTIA